MKIDFRKKALRSKTLNEKVRNITSAAICWRNKDTEEHNKENHEEKRKTTTNPSPLQETDSDPVMLGGDVKTLYPSLDCVATSEMAAQAVRDTKIMFGGIDYNRLSVYLTLSDAF